jgi:hypothetical protein
MEGYFFAYLLGIGSVLVALAAAVVITKVMG